MRKLLLVALFIGIAMKVAPPMPGQNTGAASNSSDKATQKRQGDKNSTDPPAAPPKPNSGGNSQGVAPKDKEQSVTLTKVPPITIVEKEKTWKDHLFDWGPWVFNLLLVGVGFLQVVLLQRTWATINRQTEIQEANLIQWADLEPIGLRTEASPDSEKVPKEVTIIPTWKLVNPTSLPFTVQAVRVSVARDAGWEVSEFEIDEVVPPTGRAQDWKVFSAPIALTREETTQFLATGLEFAINIQITYRSASGRERGQSFGDMYVCERGKLEINRPIGRNPKNTWTEEYEGPSTLEIKNVRTLEEEGGNNTPEPT